MNTFAIIGGGNSLDPADVEFLRMTEARVICVNNTYQIAPWAHYLYARDYSWWACVPDTVCRIWFGEHHGYSIGTRPNNERWTHAERSHQEFAGERWTGDERAHSEFNLRYTRTRSATGLCAIPGVIHEGGEGASSGYQAVNWAIHLGARKILLYAFDMGATGAGHWHGQHPAPLGNVPATGYHPFAKAFNSMTAPLRDMGVEVVNCSSKSNITCFRFSTLQDELPVQSRFERRETHEAHCPQGLST